MIRLTNNKCELPSKSTIFGCFFGNLILSWCPMTVFESFGNPCGCSGINESTSMLNFAAISAMCERNVRPPSRTKPGCGIGASKLLLSSGRRIWRYRKSSRASQSAEPSLSMSSLTAARPRSPATRRHLTVSGVHAGIPKYRRPPAISRMSSLTTTPARVQLV